MPYGLSQPIQLIDLNVQICSADILFKKELGTNYLQLIKNKLFKSTDSINDYLRKNDHISNYSILPINCHQVKINKIEEENLKCSSLYNSFIRITFAGITV
jgi:hypothetical protein